MDKLAICILVLSVVALANAVCPNWSAEEARQNIMHLQQEITRHDKAYFVNNQPLITDNSYDKLTAKLQFWQSCFGIKSNQTTLADTLIATDNSKNTMHYKFMGSLSKKNLNNIDYFLKKIKHNTIVAQPKIDGIAVEIIYENGILARALTRGDGDFGMDISNIINKTPNIPKKLHGWLPGRDSKTIVLHGELFIRIDKASEEVLAKYSTPRQFIVALIMQKTVNMQFAKLIDFFPWSWIDSTEATDIDAIAKLYQYGYNLPKKFTDIINDVKDINYLYSYYQQKNNFPFAMDGIVIKVNNYKVRQLLGGSNLTPHWATAIKFLSPEVVTEVIDIQYSIGRTGKITPVLKLTPVTVENRVISMISVGSIDNLHKLNIAINDTISLQVKGKALAVINNVLLRPITRTKKDFNSSYNYNKCSCLTYSEQCSQQFKARLLWLVSKKGINIPQITPKIVDQLISTGIVTQLVDIIAIDELSITSVKLPPNINTKEYLKSNPPSFKQLLIGLGIPHMYEEKCSILIKAIDNPQALLVVTTAQLSKILTISNKKSSEIINYINKPEISAMLRWYQGLLSSILHNDQV
jgi:DNA ligase (NAD+)